MNKKENLIEQVKNIASSYSTKLTLRQIYYRLVANRTIENKTSNYKYLSKILVEARKTGEINYDILEDRTRDVKENIFAFTTFWKEKVENKINNIKNYPRAEYHSNSFQFNVPVIVLEKQALEGLFQDALRYRNNIFIVCRGYNSLTQIKEFERIYKQYPNKKFHCYFFSDFDPSGYDIQRNFIEQCKDLGIKFKSFKRISLKKYQVKKYGIPYAPTKRTDSRSKNWNHEGVVELDAIDPHLLQEWVKKCQNKHFDEILKNKLEKITKIQSRRAKKLYYKRLKEEIKRLEKEILNKI